MFIDSKDYNLKPMDIIRASAIKFQGLTLSELAKEYACDRATINWHLNRWGNLDRLKQDYHKARATVYWGKTRREWHEYIEKHIAPDQKMPSLGCVGEALKKGKESFDLFLAKKMGQPVPKLKRSAEHTNNQRLAQSIEWVTPIGTFLGRKEAATKNGLTLGQFIHKLKKDPANWYKKD